MTTEKDKQAGEPDPKKNHEKEVDSKKGPGSELSDSDLDKVSGAGDLPGGGRG
ncbi:MAG TPA: hypothetical protein VLE48_14190 [Terriglobales bacterium]|nr:hypothetical protein [Terriglobales bacterium]